ncbi:MAG TPA: aldo/keto reductase [Candidatus Udaeobacter sp.]|nr:aldo/keto reductase [Candidatus Udaeobacter sp.]
MKNLNDYCTLGRTGLKVSPLGLGVMTYGWGANRKTAREIFDLYRERGGNFFDTADMYAGGESESWLGDFVQETKARDQAVVATKFSFNAQPGNPNAGGNGRKNIMRALEGSLRRLKTDYVDIYILHAWDRVTPVEEVMSTLNDLVRAGKIRHIGFSDVPAWYAARAQTLAELRGYERLALLQLEYSLVSRNLEREHVPLAVETGISIVPWSPLASGFLTGKYRREGGAIVGSGRVFDNKDSGNPTLEKFSKREQNWKVLDAVVAVAKELDKTPAQIALAWVAGRPQVTSVLVGATNRKQLELNLGALTVELPLEMENRLTEVSQLESTELDHFFEPTMQAMIHGAVPVYRGVS